MLSFTKNSGKENFLISISNFGAISVTNAPTQGPSEAWLKKLSILLRELSNVLGENSFGLLHLTPYFMGHAMVIFFQKRFFASSIKVKAILGRKKLLFFLLRRIVVVDV